MYVDVKMGKRGEIVIPAFVRRSLKLKEGGTVKLKVEDNSVSFSAARKDVVAWFREVARTEGIPKEKLIYGDKLYEEVFG